jgi:hypothetical protein
VQANRNAVVAVQVHVDEEGSLSVAYLWGTATGHPIFLCIWSTSKIHPTWMIKKKKKKELLN